MIDYKKAGDGTRTRDLLITNERFVYITPILSITYKSCLSKFTQKNPLKSNDFAPQWCRTGWVNGDSTLTKTEEGNDNGKKESS